jgi:hypothetical protein
MNNAMELRMKTVPSETAISSALACTIGPIAAIALPPQMAVPVEIKYAVVPRTKRNFPISVPASNANPIPNAV